jgi:Rrf2 family transcriptional regulator, nitric oxide-sensitive transcriptional repressor
VISQTTEYALRAIVDLSYHNGETRTTQQIAQATRVPAGYLAKILKDLARHGLVRAQRGLHGGFTLLGDPRVMTVYDVLAAVDPPQRIRQCPLGLKAHRVRLCPLHQRLDDAMAMVEDAFRGTTIMDVTADVERQPLRESRGIELTISGGLAVPDDGAVRKRSGKRGKVGRATRPAKGGKSTRAS